MDIQTITSDANKIIIKEQTSASSREHQAQQQDTKSQDISKLDIYTTRIKDIPHYKAKLEYKTYNSDIIGNEIKIATLSIPCSDIPDLTTENIAYKLNQYRLENQKMFANDKKILIQSLAVMLSNNEFSKFYK